MTSRVPFHGAEHEAVPVAIENQVENWNEYHLADGTILRAKQVVSAVFRLTNPTEYDGEGNPIYIVRSNNLVVPDSPQDLRRTDA